MRPRRSDRINSDRLKSAEWTEARIAYVILWDWLASGRPRTPRVQSAHSNRLLHRWPRRGASTVRRRGFEKTSRSLTRRTRVCKSRRLDCGDSDGSFSSLLGWAVRESRVRECSIDSQVHAIVGDRLGGSPTDLVDGPDLVAELPFHGENKGANSRGETRCRAQPSARSRRSIHCSGAAGVSALKLRAHIRCL
jgi:hypothetical protein